jgi:cytochrome b involved in lipid metabolism
LSDRTASLVEGRFEKKSTQNLKDDIPGFMDLDTIHEAYQFLMKTYVDERRRDILFLSVDEIMTNQYEKRNSNISKISTFSSQAAKADKESRKYVNKDQRRGSITKVIKDQRRGGITNATKDQRRGSIGKVNKERRGSITSATSANLFAREYTKLNKKRKGPVSNVNKERRGQLINDINDIDVNVISSFRQLQAK